MSWQPLSVRESDQPAAEAGPYSGVPAWLKEPILGWIRPFFRYRHSTGGLVHRLDYMRSMQVALRLDPPLNWRDGQPKVPFDSLCSRVYTDPVFALDLVDFLLGTATTAQARDIAGILTVGGSEWEVLESLEDRNWHLSKRSVGPVQEAVVEVLSLSARSGHHLNQAWTSLMGRNPSPSEAYSESIKAVEVVAKPVVSPANEKATLGTMIRDLRAKPEKWSVALEGVEATAVADMAETVWRAQPRHGTDEETAPLSINQDEADAAFHISLALVRLFAAGLIRRTD